MDYTTKPQITPRIIIHGGAGNLTRENLPSSSYNAYRSALLQILRSTHTKLLEPGATALDIATYAVSLLERNPLFNAGHGAVYTTAGTIELEASVMVSTGYRKRGVGVMKVRRTKSPIKLAREMLVRGEQEDGGGAQGHCQLEGETIERLGQSWGLESVQNSYFWTRRRWDEHRRGLGLDHGDEEFEKQRREADSLELEQGDEVEDVKGDDICEEDTLPKDPSWDGREYLPQGTVGAVVLDSYGVLCCATSTGGLTNKLPGRIGDTPTLGAGFWGEQWFEASRNDIFGTSHATPLSQLSSWIGDCLPGLSSYSPIPSHKHWHEQPQVRAVAMSGTGNGDSFLRMNAVRTSAAIARYGSTHKHVSLQQALTEVAGPNGQLQRSAGDRWHKTGEGEGGIIGIELVDGKGRICYDFNCGGMFHAWVDDDGKARFELFQDGPRPPP